MRVALISMANAAVVVAGKSVPERQIEFAIAWGAERIIASGDGASAAAIALRHFTEWAGARFQAVRDAYELMRAVRPDDVVLVLAPNLLPDNTAAVEWLADDARILVVPAHANNLAGFERIDLERAWAGALSMPGRLVERLAQLPADSAPAPALLRIALQADTPEARVPEGWLADRSWTVLDAGASVDSVSRDWLVRHLPAAARFAPTETAARHILERFGARWLSSPLATRASVAASGLLLAGAAAIAWFGGGVAAFAVLALGSVAADIAAGIARLTARLGAAEGRLTHALRWGVDLALVTCLIGALDGSALHRVFPALVLVASLRAVRSDAESDVHALVLDRTLAAAVLAAAALLHLLEPVAMGLGLLAIGVEAAKNAGKNG